MAITIDEVRHVARLARLELDSEELATFQFELNTLLGYFEEIQAIEVPGTSSSLTVPLKNVWATDRARRGYERELILRNAYQTRAGLFVVPTIIED